MSITGDGEVSAEAREKWDGSCDVEYVTSEPGDYEIDIKFAEQSIPGSPFKIKVISPKKDVIAYGPGLHMVREGVPAKFTVDASKCIEAPVKVRLSPDMGQQPQVKSKGDGLYEVTYQPPPAGNNIRLDVTFDDEYINGSPFEVKVLPFVEPNKVTLSGPGVSPFCTASFPIDFIVDTSNAGYGDLEVQVVVSVTRFRKVFCINYLTLIANLFLSISILYQAFNILYLHISFGMINKNLCFFFK